MNFFDYLRKPGSGTVKRQPLQVRKEVILIDATPANKTSRSPLPQVKGRKISPHNSDNNRERPHTRKSLLQGTTSRKRPTPEQVLESSTESSDSEGAIRVPHKKSKTSLGRQPDSKRQVRSSQVSSLHSGIHRMVHAADITSLDIAIKFVPLFEGLAKEAEILLQYPSFSPQEK